MERLKLPMDGPFGAGLRYPNGIRPTILMWGARYFIEVLTGQPLSELRPEQYGRKPQSVLDAFRSEL